MCFYDLRKECVKKYGEEFGKDYDTVCAGGSIGDFVDTSYFLGMVEEVKAECEAKYNPAKRFTRWMKHWAVTARIHKDWWYLIPTIEIQGEDARYLGQNFCIMLHFLVFHVRFMWRE